MTRTGRATRSGESNRTGGRVLAALCALFAGGLAVTGCGGDGPTDSDEQLAAGASSDLAVAVAEQAEGVLVARTDESGPADTTGSDSSFGGTILFSRARACPQGGQATMAGRLARDFEPEGQELTVDFSMTIVHEDCVVGSGSGSLNLTGAPGLDVRAAYRQVDGRLAGPQRATVEGEVDWRSPSGTSGSCSISVEAVLDPAEATFSVQGEACGHPVDRTLDR